MPDELAVPGEKQGPVEAVFVANFGYCFGGSVFTRDFEGDIAADKREQNESQQQDAENNRDSIKQASDYVCAHINP
jgi:hypothetical protein